MSAGRPSACSIDDCPKPNFSRTWCQKHYTVWRRHGDPLYQRPPSPPSPCQADDCGEAARFRGYCNPHYKRWRRWGDPLIRRPKRAATDRFWAKVDKNGPMPATFRHRGSCWQWTAGVMNSGYGQFHPTAGSHTLAHRFAYEAIKGPIPDGLHVDHLCRNRRCVNPDHLEAVTPAENNRRGLSVAVFNALKTHCPAGHQYSAENTYRSPRGTRICRACARDRDRQPHRRSSVRRQSRKAA